MDNIVSLREFIIRTRWVKKCPRRGVGARDPRAFSEKRKSSFSRNWTNILIDFILHTQARVRRVRHDMTIAKSQGQTCKGRVAVYMPEPVFEHGSLYVALSRVTMRKICTSVSQKKSTCRRAARVRARQAAER